MCTHGGHRGQGEGGVNGGLERQNWGTQEKGEGEDRVRWREAWRKGIGGSMRSPFRVEESYRLTTRLEG